jgi:hypothetical protein
MPRQRKDPDDPALKPVAAEILNEFVQDGMLTARLAVRLGFEPAQPV